MDKRIIYFDLETKFSADEVGGWGNIADMGMSVGVLYDSLEQSFHVYIEQEVPELIEQLKQADCVVGFNHINFDHKVLAGYYDNKARRAEAYDELCNLNNFDMLIKIKDVLGHRLKLDSIATATLNAQKSAHGLQALEWYRQGEIDKIIEYCKQDVAITRQIFEYALQHKELRYESRAGIKTVTLDWDIESITATAKSSAENQLQLF